jgi:hypothetical protein
MKPEPTRPIEDFVYTPVDASRVGLAQIEHIERGKGRAVRFPIDEIHPYFAPVWGGQIATVVAQTSQYKSGMLDLIARKAAEDLVKAGRTNEAVIQVMVEESIEDKAISEMARTSGEDPARLSIGEVQDWSRLRASALSVSGIPIYRIGDSLANPDLDNMLTLSNMIRAVQYMRNKLNIQPALLTFDYLQAFPLDLETKEMYQPEQQRRLQVRRDVYRLRKLARWLDAPVWLGVQGRQNLSGARGDLLIPGVYDGEETSSIAQATDRMLTQWMPKMTHPLGSTITYGSEEHGISFQVTEDLLFVKVAKQKGGLPSGRVFMCRINYQDGEIVVDQRMDTHRNIK